MDFFEQLGTLALGSRLRRISDRIMQDGAAIYSYAQLGFEPRWFPIFSILAQQDRLSLADLARELGITHPSVHQTLAEMTRAKLVTSVKDKDDKRKRLISLSKRGKALVPKMVPIWGDIRAAVDEVVAETGIDLLAALAKMEAALDQERLGERFHRHHRLKTHDPVEVITYEPQYRARFEELNRQWIEFYFEVEPADEKAFADPERLILGVGGEIFFAREVTTSKILGTVALIKLEDGSYELSKMAVEPEARGRQIGKLLVEAALNLARRLGLSSIMLLSNTKLEPAIALYRKMGFREVQDADMSEYRRANICMVHDLENQPAVV